MYIDIKLLLPIIIMIIAHFIAIDDFKASGIGAGIGWLLSIMCGIILSLVSYLVLNKLGF